VRRLEKIRGFLVVALLAFFDDFPRILFPGSHRVDVTVTVAAVNAVQHVNACIVFCGFFFVAADALNLLRRNCSGGVFVNINNGDMAAGAGIFAMNGGGKDGWADLFSMTLQAG
jgi:hypothetical protein